MNVVLGIDQSNTATGLACVRAHPDPRKRVHAFLAHPMLDGEEGVVRSVTERVWPTLRGWLGENPGPAHVWVELAPPTMRADVNHGAQAAIGFAQGWLGGLIAGGLLEGGCDVHLAPVSDWRATMLRTAIEIGCPLSPPRRGREDAPDANPERFRVASGGGTSFVRTWTGCGHEERLRDFAELNEAQTTRCPACRGSRPTMSSAEAVRDAWKAIACLFVRALAPTGYGQLVAQARGRARKKDAPDHHLVGVADACEAVGIALHGLSVTGAR